jgi:hypothetical protein
MAMLFSRARAVRERHFHAVRRLYRQHHRKDTPEIRGLRLLRAWLSTEQRAQFDALGYFDVIGCDSGKKYRIYVGTSANIQELDHNDRPLAGWCFVPKGRLVPGDVMLAQKIAFETGEHSALAAANRLPPAFRQTGLLIPMGP